MRPSGLWNTVGINARLQVTGHLWQGRFGSVVMDERHLMAAARYVPMNPVRAGLVERAADWPWSSARAHLAGRDDGVVTVRPLLDRVGDFAQFLEADQDATAVQAVLRGGSTGRPAGGADWTRELEAATGLTLAPRKRGPKPRAEADPKGALLRKLSPWFD